MKFRRLHVRAKPISRWRARRTRANFPAGAGGERPGAPTLRGEQVVELMTTAAMGMIARGVGVALCVGWHAPAAAQSMADLAAYAGADRAQKLADGAKKEGTVTLYGSTPTEDMAPLIAAFEAKYGVKVRLWRGGPEDLLRRASTEARGGRHEFDVLETNTPTVEALRREGLFQKVVSPAQDDLAPQVRYPHGEYMGTRLNIIIAGYNTNLVKKADLPADYAALRDPKWKGKLAWE